MTIQTPSPGNAPGLSASRIDTAEVIKARIAQWCEWFDLDAPTLRIWRGQIYMTDSLADWLGTSGASFDWILSGDEKCMAAAYREKYAMESRVLNALKGFDDVEVAMLTAALKRATANDLPMDDVLAEFTTAVAARRAENGETAGATKPMKSVPNPQPGPAQEVSTPGERQELLNKLLPWLSDFCEAHDFYSRSGYTNVSRSLSMCTGSEPKTKKERAFLALMLAEINRRFPGNSYPEILRRTQPKTVRMN
jgi:hypothetical protein